MKKTLYTLMILGLSIPTAQAHWEFQNNFERPGKVFHTQKATCALEMDDETNVRQSLVGKTLSPATVEHITPTALLHFKCHENYSDPFFQSFYVTQNCTNLTEESQNFNGLQEAPWASIDIDVKNGTQMKISILPEDTQDQNPAYASTIADALCYLIYDYAPKKRDERVPDLATIIIEDRNQETFNLLQGLIAQKGMVFGMDTKFIPNEQWKMEFTFTTQAKNKFREYMQASELMNYDPLATEEYLHVKNNNNASNY